MEKKTNFPNVSDDLLPALQNKSTCEVVADNLNALHSARQNFIKSESSKKIKDALRHKTRTFSDVVYNNGDIFIISEKGLIYGKDLQL